MKQDKPSLLFLGSQMTIGGAQRVLLSLADWFHQQGYPVTAAFFYDKDRLQPQWQSKAANPIIDLRAWSSDGHFIVRLFNLLRGLVRLFHLMRSSRFDGILTFTHDSNFLGIPIAWLAGIPLRVASHHGRIHRYNNRQHDLHAWMVNSGLTTCLVAVSERVKRQSIEEGISSQKIIVITNAVHQPEVDPQAASRIRRMLGLQVGAHLIITVGRLNTEKGHSQLLQAAPAILAKFPDTMFALAGDGPLRTDLEAETQRMGITSQVHFLGNRSDIPDLLSAADVFVLPSQSEGLPNALLEAMAVGLPVVSFDVGGVAEVISHGETGLLVQPEDTQGLSQALISLLADPEKRQRMGADARLRMQSDFTFETMCRRYESVLSPYGRIGSC